MQKRDYIRRDLEDVVLKLTKEYSCIIISGPRQVGKTTMLRHIATEDRRFISLDDVNERDMARRDPEMFLAIHPAPILVDEVQYAPELFSYIKMKIDDGAPAGSYWLTGSQSFALMKLAQESLAGRAAILRMTTLSQKEIYGEGENKPFNIDIAAVNDRQKGRQVANATGIYERIFNGALPGHVSGKYTNREAYYSSYMQTYISRDVRDEIAGVDDQCFADFIRAAACRTGQVLNIHAIASDVGISDDTAKRWLAILEKSDVIFYLTPYSNNLLKRTIKTKKLYFFDTGLVAYLTRYSSPEILMNGSLNGAILENYVVAEIRKTYFNNGSDCNLHYYRDKDDREIDLVIEADGLLHPIEIKKAATPTLSMISSFKILKKASIPTGMGAVVCLKENVSALDSENLIIPIWII